MQPVVYVSTDIVYLVPMVCLPIVVLRILLFLRKLQRRVSEVLGEIGGSTFNISPVCCMYFPKLVAVAALRSSRLMAMQTTA